MKQKNMLVSVILLILALCLAACTTGMQTELKPTPAAETAVDGEEGALPAPTQDMMPAEPSTSNESPSAEDAVDAQETRSDVLVVYFSATGTTKGVAERIAVLTGGDLREIVPAMPYTAEDLDYRDRMTRASAEQNDPDARPQIAEDISLDGYSTVYLGYPIWWGQAPRILSTFVESHDFSGITVLPFCTSGSSDIGQSDDALAEQAASGRWLPGKRFPGTVSESDLKSWIDESKEANMEKSLRLLIDDVEVAVSWEANASVEALKELAAAAPVNIQMSMYGGFEQVGPLGFDLPRDDSQTTTQAGDIVLYSGNQVVIFYGSNSWAYTRLGRITDRSAAQMKELLGSENVAVTILLGE